MYNRATEEQISAMRDALRPALDQVVDHVRDKHGDKVKTVVPSVDPPGGWCAGFRLLITLTIDDDETGKPVQFTRSFFLDADAYNQAGKVDFKSCGVDKSFRHKKKTGWPIAGIVSYFCASLDIDIVDMYARRAHDAEALKQRLRAHEIKESFGWRTSIFDTTHVKDSVAYTEFSLSMGGLTVEQLLPLNEVLGGALKFDFERRGLTIDQIEAIHKALLPTLKPS